MSDGFDRDYDFEHGWQALAGLAGRMSTHLQSVQGSDEYAPVGPWEVVPVEPCPFCADGGLRTAGYITRNRQVLPVRQCDTCHAVQIGTEFFGADDASARGDDDDSSNEDDDGWNDEDDQNGGWWQRGH